MSKPQNIAVLRWLGERPITSLDAVEHLGVHRLAARIADLKAEGHVITTELVTVPNRYGQRVRCARYRLQVAA